MRHWRAYAAAGAAAVGAAAAGVVAAARYRAAKAPAAQAPGAVLTQPAAGTGVFRTPSESADVVGGWAPIGGGVEVTRLPLFDTRQDVRSAGVSFARLDYAAALAAAARLGARLPTVEELDREAALSTARVLRPCTLPPTADMASQEWARRHDSCVVQFLEIRGLEPSETLVNAGKHWAAGAPVGRAINHGWYDPEHPADPSRMIQRRGTRHDAAHTDYSQTTKLARDARGAV